MSDLVNNVIIADNHTIEDGVVLGYPTGRLIPNQMLTIGSGATIRSGTVIYVGSTIGAGLETGHNVVIREENIIGQHCSIWSNSVIDYGCRLGDRVKIHANVYVAQFTVIEDDVFLAPGVIIANDPHPECSECTREQAPIIKRGARIGANVTLLPGIVVGEYSLVGAGSVVTRNVPPGTVVYGNPARVAKRIDDLVCPHDPEKRAYLNGLDRKTRQQLQTNSDASSRQSIKESRP
jgi:acetyltransferase-like isoleucine patch superfamily enzyme